MGFIKSDDKKIKDTNANIPALNNTSTTMLSLASFDEHALPDVDMATLYEEEANKMIEKLKKELRENKRTMQEKDNAIQENKRTIQEKDNAIQERDNVIQEKDNAIQERDNTIHDLKQLIRK